MCQINSVNLKCGTRRRKFRRIANKAQHNLVLAEIELEVKPQKPTGEMLYLVKSELFVTKVDREQDITKLDRQSTMKKNN